MEKSIENDNFEEFKWGESSLKGHLKEITLEEKIRNVNLALRDSGKANLTKKTLDELLQEIEDLKKHDINITEQINANDTGNFFLVVDKN